MTKVLSTKLTVLVVTLLLVFSSFTFLPALAYQGASGTNAVKSSPSANAALPTVSGAPNVVVGTTNTTFSVQVTNPSSNAYAITSITVIAPSGWSFQGKPPCGTDLNTKGAYSSTAVQCTAGTGSGLPPGFSDTLGLGGITGPASVSTSPPVSGTFTTLVVDASGTGSYAGSSFTELSIATTTVTVTMSPTSGTFTAGSSPYTITATLSSKQSGVPIVWSVASNYPSVGFTSTLSPTSGLTGSAGTAVTTFAPSNHHGDSTAVTATIGTSSISGPSTTITTQAGAPTQVSFTFTSGSNTYATDYLVSSTSVGSPATLYAESNTGTPEISLSLADAYANPVAFSSSITNISLTGIGGQFLSGSNLYSTISCGTVSAGNSHFTCPTSGNSLSLPFPYLQSSVYGTVGEIAGAITASSSTYTGTSGNIVTSTLGTLGTTGATSTSMAATVAAGSSILVQNKLSVAQAGVPITLNLCTAPSCASTSPGYDGKFSNGLGTITLTSNSTGGVEALMPANTTAQSKAYFNSTALAPTMATPTATITGAMSASVTTIPGTIKTLVVNVAAGTPPNTGHDIQYAVNGTKAYVAIAYADAYGNLVTSPAPSNQIQIALTPSAGSLSATNVYIPAGMVTTNQSGSFGSILWTFPNTIGQTVSISASANVNGNSATGTASVSLVSASPTIAVSSPTILSGIAYSNTAFVTFKGTANATLGSASTNIASIGYKVGSGAWQSITTAAQHNVVFTIPVVLASGMNTITFNATDNAGVTTVASTLKVLVDSSAPSIGAPALSGNSAVVQINDTEGDLNASSVQAWINGTAVSTSSISVSGTNNPGSSVTYTVTVTGLSTGTSTVKVSASDLAGNSASNSGSVTVSVAQDQSYSIGTSAQGKVGPYNVVNASVTSHWTTSQSVVVFAVVKNSANQTVEVATADLTIAAGATIYATPVLNVGSGTYTVQIFVWSTSGVSLSQTTTLTVKI